MKKKRKSRNKYYSYKDKSNWVNGNPNIRMINGIKYIYYGNGKWERAINQF